MPKTPSDEHLTTSPAGHARPSYWDAITAHCASYADYSKRLASYTAAAGLGAFSMGQTADAAIVHVDLGDGIAHNEAGSFTDLDLDSNGTVDFVFGQATLSYSGVRMSVFGNPLFAPEARLPLDELSQNYTNTENGNPYYIRSFQSGDVIGPGAQQPLNGAYPNYTGIVSTNTSNFRNDSEPQYWGFGLNINGEIHYGWGRLTTFNDGGSPAQYTAVLHEYAYQSEPDVAIVAGVVPEASSLALLAAGFGGLGLAAKRKRAAA